MSTDETREDAVEPAEADYTAPADDATDEDEVAVDTADDTDSDEAE